MTLLFMDGFDDLYEDDDLLKKWDYYVMDYGQPFEVFPTGGRFGNGCIGCSLRNSYIAKGIPETDELICGFAFKFDTGIWSTSYGILKIYCGFTENGKLLLNADGTLEWEGYSTSPDWGPTTNALSPDTWYYIEVKLKIHNTEGIIEVRVNGSQWLYGTGDTIWLTSYDKATHVRLIGPDYLTGKYLYYDDVYILNTSGSNNNDFLGNVRVNTLKPNGAGNYAQFTPSAGNNYQCVDDIDWSGSDYVQTTTDGQIDTHTFEELPSSGVGQIYGVQVCTGSKKLIESDATKMKHVIRKNSTNYISDAVDAPDEFLTLYNMYELDPEDSQAWTKAKLDVTEFGYQSVIP